MAFVTDGLLNGGRTEHYSVFYDDSLALADGRDAVNDLLFWLEKDFVLMQGSFTGVNFQFLLPIRVELTGEDGGAGWTDPPDIVLSSYQLTVTLKPGPHPTTALLRYLMVSEVTEMFMASQRKDWFGPTGIFWGADERSMGESLSRFLASEFVSGTLNGRQTPSGFSVVRNWLNDLVRPNFVDTTVDDNQPDTITGCGTCFLFFLRYQ